MDFRSHKLLVYVYLLPTYLIHHILNDPKVKLVIGTRGSKLALWQSEHTQSLLAAIGIESDLQIIKTKGDQIQHLSFDKIEGKGFFTKEIEDELIDGSVDIAVHSLKDMPTTQPEGLVLGAVLKRADPADWLIVNKSSMDDNQALSLKSNPVIGTSSARRKAQILQFRPDAEIKDIRGNVPTRLRKLAEGQFDGILLAAAGLTRLELDLSDFHVVKFNPREFVPAPAQGVVAIQCRAEDISVRRILKKIHQSQVSQISNIERGVLKMMNGGCQMPLGVHCQRDINNNYHVYAAYASTWDGPIQKAQFSSSTTAGLAKQVFEAINPGT